MTRSPVALLKRAARELAARGRTLAVAESCTGGMLGALLTSIPGSSQWFRGGVIAYANDIKTSLLGLSPALLRTRGAVSSECAAKMASGVRRRFRADCGVSITGIAGPSGGTATKPVGLVFIGFADRRGAKVCGYMFAGGRDTVRRQGCEAALRLLLDMQH